MHSEFLLHKDVYTELEFYLPQIAHMIIHVGVGDETILLSLDRLTVILSQGSLHVALKLTFILKAAMEDYQEEISTGEKNPCGNAALYMRCARLIYIIERVAIYGLPKVEQEDHLGRSMSGFYEETGLRELANTILGADSRSGDIMSGKLLYKRRTRAFLLQRKVWKERYFKIQHRVLYCFHDSEYKILRRSINLKDCIVDDASESRHKYFFEVRDCDSDTVFQLRASSDEEAASWINVLKAVSTGIPRPVEALLPPAGGDHSFVEEEVSESETSPDSPVADRAHDDSSPSKSVSDASLLTSQQRERLAFFNQEQEFIKDLTDICDRLRFMEREERGENLRREMRNLKFAPYRTYLPLCNSTDPWRTVLNVLPDEGHAFTTKARCPALMIFELEEHPLKMDIASFLFTDMSVSESLMKPVPSALTEQASPELNGSTNDRSLFKISCSMPSDAGHPEEKEVEPSPAPTSIFHASVKRLSVVNLNPDNVGPYKAALDVKEMSFKKEREEIERGQELARSTSPTEDVEPVKDEDVQLDMGGSPSAEELEQIGIQEETKAWTTGSETFAEKTERLRKSSEYSELKNWKLDGLIAKSNDDLRQEVI